VRAHRRLLVSVAVLIMCRRSVPVSRLPDLVLETKADMAKSGITSTVVGHVGDGNFHALLLFRNEKELDVVTGLVHRMVERAIGMDGTCASLPVIASDGEC
jgi:FAD/FMN-containing dehydrogenase